MEDVRETAIRNLGEPYRFHWKPMDFVKAWSTVPDEAANRRLIESLSGEPSVIVYRSDLAIQSGNQIGF